MSAEVCFAKERDKSVYGCVFGAVGTNDPFTARAVVVGVMRFLLSLCSALVIFAGITILRSL
jgi:hypothetical protein